MIENNVVFNLTVCIIGIAILSIHIFNFLVKKNKRKDEFALGNFLVFTVIHFITYLVFTLVKLKYTSNTYIISFYTVFYIFNNLEVFFLFVYMLRYVDISSNAKRILTYLNLILLSLFLISDIVNIFTRMYFTSVDGVYIRSKFMIISQGYQFVMLLTVFITALINKKLIAREKAAFFIYCMLPVVAIILQNLLPGYAIAYLSIILATEVLFFFLNVRRNIQLIEEQEKSKEARIKVMMSQIQPHFIYNSLSSISTLIPIDPKKAQEALDNFTEYLRSNLSSLTETSLIPFEDELRHIKTYLSLEKLRFNERVNIKYEIKTKDFMVPPLSIQPVVENAVKHGILKKVEGGTVEIKTYADEKHYFVEVTDDGVGFNIDEVEFDSNRHIGLNNIKSRLKSMSNATLELESAIGLGTTVKIIFNK